MVALLYLAPHNGCQDLVAFVIDVEAALHEQLFPGLVFGNRTQDGDQRLLT
jgi:hypothetical protein